MQFYSLAQSDYQVTAFLAAPSPRVAQIRGMFVLTMMRGEAAWRSPITVQVVPVERVAPPWFPNEFFSDLEATLRFLQAPPAAPAKSASCG